MLFAAAALALATQPTTEPTNGCPGGLVLFERGSARLETDALRNIEMMLLWARPMMDAGAWLNLYGSADDGVSSTAEMDLSRSRAEAVRDYLLRRGFRAEQLRPLPRGNSIALVAPAQGRSDPQNRFVNLAPEMPVSVFRRFFPPGAPIC
jgi:outer membrane protein OmpA-like peptidoglycan-associated protein